MGIRAFHEKYIIGGNLQRGSGKLLEYFEHHFALTLISDLLDITPNIITGENNDSSGLTALQAASATQNFM